MFMQSAHVLVFLLYIYYRLCIMTLYNMFVGGNLQKDHTDQLLHVTVSIYLC